MSIVFQAKAQREAFYDLKGTGILSTRARQETFVALQHGAEDLQHLASKCHRVLPGIRSFDELL